MTIRRKGEQRILHSSCPKLFCSVFCVLTIILRITYRFRFHGHSRCARTLLEVDNGILKMFNDDFLLYLYGERLRRRENLPFVPLFPFSFSFSFSVSYSFYYCTECIVLLLLFRTWGRTDLRLLLVLILITLLF